MTPQVVGKSVCSVGLLLIEGKFWGWQRVNTQILNVLIYGSWIAGWIYNFIQLSISQKLALLL